jgi:hypothetical protein
MSDDNDTPASSDLAIVGKILEDLRKVEKQAENAPAAAAAAPRATLFGVKVSSPTYQPGRYEPSPRRSRREPDPYESPLPTYRPRPEPG